MERSLACIRRGGHGIPGIFQMKPDVGRDQTFVFDDHDFALTGLRHFALLQAALAPAHWLPRLAALCDGSLLECREGANYFW
jgi:hypothetical protein